MGESLRIVERMIEVEDDAAYGQETIRIDGHKRRFLESLRAAGFIERVPGGVRRAYSSHWLLAAVNPTVFGNGAQGRKCEDRDNAWLTPTKLLPTIRKVLGGPIGLDPCTEPDNPTRALRFYTAADDGLRMPWCAKRIFCNPPYSPVSPWIYRCIDAAQGGSRVVVLLPVRTDAQYHQDLFNAATDILFFKGRLSFRRADGEPAGKPAFCSMLVGINASCGPAAHLGVILKRGASRTARAS